MHKAVDDKGVAVAASTVCRCGAPRGLSVSEDGVRGILRRCPRCDFSPPLIAA
jgi:hypothetical protein